MDIPKPCSIWSGDSPQLLQLATAATHGGGVCFIAMTYASPSSQDFEDPSKWRNVYTFPGDCPATTPLNLDTVNNNSDDYPSGVQCSSSNSNQTDCVHSYTIPMPDELMDGPATFAWVWLSHLTDETYMNCAPITIAEAKNNGGFDLLPDLKDLSFSGLSGGGPPKNPAKNDGNSTPPSQTTAIPTTLTKAYLSTNTTATAVSEVPTFNITIGDNSPIWFYCTAHDSCHPNGMVGVINPAKGQSIDTQKSAAINADYQLLPGQSWPAEGSSPGSQPSSTSSPSKNSKSQKVPGGAIAGIVIGILLATVLIAALVFVVRRARQRNAPKNPEEDSMSLAEGDAEEQTVPVAMEFEPATPRVQSELVSPLSPTPQRNKSLLRTFYKYPFMDKPPVAPKGHPASRLELSRNTATELEGEGAFIDRASR
ncbi:hypothetical protein AG0111_0g12077 [Alternaria gaisen]|uniref:Uncharacterized protein n=1 Tax=Alternaria gaisen TaxID=167740 RepID=A0ACB6F5N4_9PLEO|nr:hypothetical protein AG0111_0g12077 [Alternaria gaisen]